MSVTAAYSHLGERWSHSYIHDRRPGALRRPPPGGTAATAARGHCGDRRPGALRRPPPGGTAATAARGHCGDRRLILSERSAEPRYAAAERAPGRRTLTGPRRSSTATAPALRC